MSRAESVQVVRRPRRELISRELRGSQTTCEMLKCYYRTRIFKFAYLEQSSLHESLHSESTGPGVRPVYYLRRLHLVI